MYIANKPPKRSANIQIPQHVKKMIQQIQKTKDKGHVASSQEGSELTKILERFAVFVSNDDTLLSIYHSLSWDDTRRVFKEEVSYDKLVELVEKEYDIKVNEMDADVEQHPAGASYYPVPGLSFNSSFSDSMPFIKTEVQNDPFFVKKPVAITNSLGVDTYPMNDPDFLTNSAKGWYMEKEDDASLISNWRSKFPIGIGSSGFTPQRPGASMKYPSFQVEKQTPTDRRHNFFSNSSTVNNVSNVNVKEEYVGGYNDYMKKIGGNLATNGNNSNFTSSFTTSNNNFGKSGYFSYEDESEGSNVEEEVIIPKKQTVKKIKKKAISTKVKRNKVETSTRSPLRKKPQPVLQASRNSNFGLKEISKKVKDIVKNYKNTTYKDISDILVNNLGERELKDEKNIRRRIYDSLNVMKAMKLFTKDRETKRIYWNGESKYFDEPSTKLKPEETSNFSFRKKQSVFQPQQEDLSNLKLSLQTQIEESAHIHQSLLEQYTLLTKLIHRNKTRLNPNEDEKVKLPFIILEFPEHNSNINITSNESKTKIHFSLDNALKVYGDLDAIGKIKLDNLN